MILDAFRSLRAAPRVTAFILLILTLTIAAATVTFSVVDAVVLRPLPFAKPSGLVQIAHDRGDRVMSQARAMSAVQFLAVRERADAFETLAAVSRGPVMLDTGGQPERVWSARVTASLFDVLGVQPLIGRAFDAAHEIAGSERVAVISYGLWRRRFGSDPAIIGRVLKTVGPGGIDAELAADGSLVVLGVMPEGFSYPLVDDRLTDIWTPYVIPEQERAGAEQSSYLHLVGRLRGGVSLVQAQRACDEVRKALAAAERVYAYSPSGRFTVTRLDEAVAGPVRGWMLLVLLAVALLLVVACANVANLLLTRAIDRARELSIRVALGASSRRLFASLLLESVMLSLCAVALALAVSWWGIGAARASLPPGIARADQIALDLRVFGAAVTAAVLTGLLFGVIPAFQASRGDVAAVLRSGAATIAGTGSRWRSVVLVSEIAFASVLLVATTLFVSSFIRLTRADLGFDRANLLLVDPAGLQGTVAEFVDRLRSVPGVVAVGGASAGSPPLVMAGFDGGASGTRVRPADAAANAEFVMTEFNRVSSGYFAAAAIPVLRGRVFGDSDSPGFSAVVLDAVAAKLLFGDQDPVGRGVTNGRIQSTVIGVVANVRMRGPEADSGPQVYFRGPSTAGSYVFLVRISGPVTRVIPGLRAAIGAVSKPGGPPVLIRPIQDAFRNITARRRFSAGSMAIFGILALVIGAVGVYGVTASLVAQRTREIGVRLALGATPRQIVGGLVGQAGRLVAAGLVLGLPAAWLVSRGFESLLFEVRPTDPWVYLIVAAVLIVFSILAALVPASRASQVDPLVALRAE